MRIDATAILRLGLAVADGARRVLTSLALAVVYVTVVVPTAVVLWVVRRKLLEGGPEPGRAGYWCEREPGASDPSRWRRQW